MRRGGAQRRAGAGKGRGRRLEEEGVDKRGEEEREGRRSLRADGGSEGWESCSDGDGRGGVEG